jgi:hypothetical protein
MLHWFACALGLCTSLRALALYHTWYLPAGWDGPLSGVEWCRHLTQLSQLKALCVPYEMPFLETDLLHLTALTSLGSLLLCVSGTPASIESGLSDTMDEDEPSAVPNSGEGASDEPAAPARDEVQKGAAEVPAAAAPMDHGAGATAATAEECDECRSASWGDMDEVLVGPFADPDAGGLTDACAAVLARHLTGLRHLAFKSDCMGSAPLLLPAVARLAGLQSMSLQGSLISELLTRSCCC